MNGISRRKGKRIINRLIAIGQKYNKHENRLVMQTADNLKFKAKQGDCPATKGNKS